jgi:hypothetical protein
MRCGGEEITLPDGRRWGRDGFFAGGADLYTGEVDIDGTPDDEIYRRARTFALGTGTEEAVCRIPLPPGPWRVRLHLAELEVNAPGYRRFDVWVQGRRVLADLDILAEVPFRAALVKGPFAAEVADGPLEIRLEAEADHLSHIGPTLSGIEIERAE